MKKCNASEIRKFGFFSMPRGGGKEEKEGKRGEKKEEKKERRRKRKRKGRKRKEKKKKKKKRGKKRGEKKEKRKRTTLLHRNNTCTTFTLSKCTFVYEYTVGKQTFQSFSSPLYIYI